MTAQTSSDIEDCGSKSENIADGADLQRCSTKQSTRFDAVQVVTRRDAGQIEYRGLAAVCDKAD